MISSFVLQPCILSSYVVLLSGFSVTGPKPSMVVTDEQRDYKGDPSDEMAVAEHKARLAEILSGQASRLKAWEERYSVAKKNHAQLSAQKAKANAEKSLKSAQKKVATCKIEVETACQALKEAVKAASK